MSWVRSISRGTALFFGLFSAINSFVQVAGNGRGENLWWIRLPFGPLWMSMTFVAGCSVPLIIWGLRGKLNTGWRNATVVACVALASIAAFNAFEFFVGWRAGEFLPAIPVPFSAVVAVLLLVIAWSVRATSSADETPGNPLGIIVVLGMWGLLFPLAHVLFFGTTDYRAPADATVVLGALVHPSGVLSQSLEERVVTGVELYREQLVPTLIMSGGVGASGVDESAAMKRRAIELGVPSRDILLDRNGVNTDATVANTTELLEANGLTRVLVVSQFYHLPRIKMAYRAAGWQVRTVPAGQLRPIAKTPLFVLREIPGFWVYWARAGWRDVVGG